MEINGLDEYTQRALFRASAAINKFPEVVYGFSLSLYYFTSFAQVTSSHCTDCVHFGFCLPDNFAGVIVLNILLAHCSMPPSSSRSSEI